MMLRTPGILTRATDKRRTVLSLNSTHKIILTLFVAALATIPLWLGLARVHSAPSNVTSPPVLQPPAVVLNVPSEVLIGENFEFEVRLKNNLGSSIGYAPYIDIYLPASGVDGNSAGLKCDGITFLSARALFTSPPSLTLPVAQDSGMDTSPNPCPNSYSTHPFTGATIFTPTPQYQLVVIPLPFGSFDPTQPENIIKVKAHLSDYADVGMPLTIYAKGGFRYGADEQDNHPTDPLVESAPVSAQTTPTLLKIKKRYLGPEDEAVSGPNFVNYYPLKYEVTVDIANGQLIQNLVVTDKLPPNLQFNGNVQVKIQGNTANPVTSCSTTPGPFDVVIASPTSTPGGTLSVTLCNSLTGSAAPDDVVVTFDFFIPDVDANGQIIINKDCSNAPVAVNNDILATGDWDPLDPRDPNPGDPAGTTVPVNSNLTNVDHVLNAKCVAIQKSVTMFQEFPGGAIGPTPGDVLRYELNFQVSDYFTIGKLVVTDFLADGQTFLGGPPPTLRVTDLFGNTGAPTAFPPLSVTTTLNQPAAAAFCPVKLQTPQLGTIVRFDVSLAMLILPPFMPRHDAGMLTGGLAAGPPTSTPATGTIVFYARINDAFKPPVSAVHKFVDKHDPINNCVSIKGAVYGNLPRPTPLNAPLNIPTTIIGSAADGSAVQTTIVGADLEKTVWAVRRGNATLCGPATINATSTSCSNLPNAPEEVRPGDRVTFRVEKPFPSGDSEAVKIEDWLPLPIFKVASGNSFNNFTCAGLPGPGISCLGPTDTLHTLVAPAKPVFIPDVPTNSITFDYKDFNNTANTSLKIDLLFTYTVTNQPFADGLFMTNEARECEDNSFGVNFCQVSIAQVKVRQPNLRIRKGIIATSNTNGFFSHQPIPSTGPLAQAPTGVTFSLGGVAGVVDSTDLAAGFLDSNLSNVDANDLLTYAITIENVGGAAAYDVKIEDIIPNTAGIPTCFTIVPGTIKVQRGTGVPVNPFLYQTVFPTATGGFTVTSTTNLPIPINAYNPTTGQNIVVITFQAKLLASITPGCCDNQAKLLHYSSVLNGLDFVSAGFTVPFDDPAEVCVNPTLTKTLVATSEAHTAGSNITIGEIARYRLVTLLPEGGSLTNFMVSDVLPAGMKFLNDGTARIAFVSNGLGITRSSFLGSTYSVSGATPPSTPLNAALQIPAVGVISGGSACGLPVDFNLGNVKNNDNDNDLEYIVIEFNALVCNEASNLNGTPLPNTFNVSVGGNQIATSNPITVIIVEPNLTMTKTVAPNPAIKGQTLTYTVQYTNNGTADAFNVELKDTLPPGLTLGTITASCPFTSGGNVITMTCAQVPKAPGSGSTVMVTYQPVANPAICPVKLNNQANLTWTSLPGLQGTTVNPTGSSTPGNSGAVDGERDGITPLLTLNDYATPASAAVKIDCPCEATISGLKFNDLNGNGVRDTGEPGLANWTIQVTNSNGITQTATTDSAGNYSLTVPAPGTYTVAEVQQSGWTQTAPTSGTYSVTVSPGQVINNLHFGNKKKIKCDLQITKDVKPNPLVSGQQATAIITVKNVGAGPCHGPTQVAESLPAGLTLVSAGVPGGSCVLSTGVCNYAPAIPAGGSVVFTYVFNVTAQPGASFENCARLKNSEDQNTANNGMCVPLTVSGEKLPDLTIQKKVQCGGPAIPQGTCNVTLTIRNNGPGSFNGSLAIQDVVTPPPSPALSLNGSPPGWSCSTGPPNNISCATTSSVSLVSGQSTTLSLSVKIPDGQFENCASVKGYKVFTQSPYNSSTLIQEGNFNNNESCVSVGRSISGDCATVPLRLFNTGVADNGSLLASGATDPHYMLLNTSPVSPNAFVLSPNQVVGYVANSATSQWLGPDPPGSNGGQGGYYTYRTTFNLDCDPSTAVISGQWSTDNEAEIFLNTQPTGISTGPGDFVAFKPFVIKSRFSSGVNTLDFRVRNRLSSRGSRTPTGLHVQMKGTVKCCSSSGSLTVTKTVENLSPTPIPAGTTFPVTVSCLPSGPNVTLNLAARGTQTLDNIPVGSKCTVTEPPLPTHISSPVCASLQWAAPTYSPGQSVTILNSGAPQAVTIQNRLVCLGRPPVDTYAFRRGMNEFCISSGGGSFNSPTQIDYANSQLGFNSPTQPGDNRGVRYGTIGLCYGRILTANDKLAFKYTFNATPVAVLSYPDVNVSIDGAFRGPLSETRRNVFGVGLSPIGFQLYFRPQSRIKPFVNTSGGFIFFKDQVPRLNGARFNFTYDVGGGVQVFRDSRRAFTFGYKYQNISNGGRALNNPGFDGHVFSFGYSIFNGQKIDQSTYERGPTDTPSFSSGGPSPVPLGVHNVGIIPDSSGGCPVGSDRIIISMDDEDKKNASSVDGWTGAISHYSTGTHFEFCRVDGNQFGSHPSGDYAVLKLSDTCPDGSVSFSRTFDNEHNKNRNSSSGDISPNKSTSATLLYFCFFPSAPTMTSFPNLNVPYGVFAAPSSAWLAIGTVFTDDDGGPNDDNTAWPAASAYFPNRFAKIIYGTDNPFLGRNTYLLVAKVSN